jgi:tetratricopeptide (TPR) repeat protein
LGERLPATEQMQVLCYVLGAREEELVALTTGRFAETPPLETTNWDEKRADLRRRIQAGFLEELHFIALDREVWHWAQREPGARSLLAWLRVDHAHHHRLQGHWDVSRTLAQQAHKALLAAPPEDQETDRFVLVKVAIVQAATAVLGGVQTAPERGIRLLRPWVDRAAALPEFSGWMLADLAKYTALAGNYDEAVGLAERACRMAERANNPFEGFLRRCDHGQLLLQAGRAGEALHILPDPLGWEPDASTVDAMLLLAEALRQTDQLSEAQDWLERASVLIAAQDLEPQRRKAQMLAPQYGRYGYPFSA